MVRFLFSEKVQAGELRQKRDLPDIYDLGAHDRVGRRAEKRRVELTSFAFATFLSLPSSPTASCPTHRSLPRSPSPLDQKTQPPREKIRSSFYGGKLAHGEGGRKGGGKSCSDEEACRVAEVSLARSIRPRLEVGWREDDLLQTRP